MQATQTVSTESVEKEMIEGLRVRIDAWRGSESRGRAMPEELWEDASAAAQMFGVCRVARALGVNYEALERRAMPSETPAESDGRTDFIELQGLAPSAAALGDEVVVEVVATDGAKLTVRTKAAALNIATLVSEFRSRA